MHAAREVAPRTLIRPFVAFALVVLAIGSALAVVSGAMGTRGPGFTVRAVMNLFWADRDLGVWAWFSTVEIVTLAAAFAVHAVCRRAAGRPFAADVFFAVAAAYLSLDEAAALHERLGSSATRLGVHGTYAWVALGLPLALIGGAVLFRVARRIDPTTRRRLVLAAGVYLLGALGLETLGGTMVESWHLPYYTPPYILEVAAEEGLEAGGILIALAAVLAQLRITVGGGAIGVAVRPGPSPASARPSPEPAAAPARTRSTVGVV